MIKQVFIINGSGGVGKDTFVEFVEMIPTFEFIGENENSTVWFKNFEIKNYSSVSKVKEIAKIIGWNGEKTERDRKFLSDLKLLTTKYKDRKI